MSLLRLAYATLFLLALIAVFTLWSQVGGQGHLGLVPWYLKLGLGCGAAFTIVKAAAAAYEGTRAWNLRTVRWLALTLVLLVGCGLALQDNGAQVNAMLGLAAMRFSRLGVLWPNQPPTTGRSR